MYQTLLREQLNALKSSNQYRTFMALSLVCGQYPLAKLGCHKEEPVVAWCSIAYLAMSQHPTVREQMHNALATYCASGSHAANEPRQADTLRANPAGPQGPQGPHEHGRWP